MQQNGWVWSMLPASGTVYLKYLTQIETFLCKQTHMRWIYGMIIDISTFELIEFLCSQPWDGKISWRRASQPTPVFLPGESHGQRCLESCSPWGSQESDMTEQLNTCYPRDLSVSLNIWASLLTFLNKSTHIPTVCTYGLKNQCLPSGRHQIS